MLIGRLTRDPELRTTTSGRNVANMTVATGRSWLDQSGQKQEKSEFHNCVLWGKIADIAGQYLTKARRVYVEGRVETRDWVGTDGVKRYRTEIIVENLIMLDGPRIGGSTPVSAPTPQASMGSSFPPIEAPVEEIKVEDIPF